MKKGIDKTSIVMISVFAAIIIGVAVVAIIFAVNKTKVEDNSLNSGDAVENVDTKIKYDTVEALVEDFKTICAQGDIDALYDLYYDDYLDLMRQNMQNPPDKATFDSMMVQNMQSVLGVDIYMYGDVELLATQPPSTYASYIFGQVNNGMELPIKGELIEDCANLVVYAGGSENNHFAVKIDGCWYMIV